MASYLRAELKCSVCLSIYRDPVYLVCGHNFCERCIQQVFESQEEMEIFTCPECRMEFHHRPKLQKNLKLSNIVEHYFSTTANQEGELYCTNCIDFQIPAVKLCRLCDTFLCENHLMVHNKSKEHVLVEPTSILVSRDCSTHKKPLKYYCCDDGSFLCVMCCALGDHKGHTVEPLNDCYKTIKVKLQHILETLMSTITETEKRYEDLQIQMEEIQLISNDQLARINGLFKLMREYLNEQEKKCISVIKAQEDEMLLQVSESIHQIELEKDTLYKKIRHTEQLLGSRDPVDVIKECEVVRSYLSDEDNVLTEENEAGAQDDFDYVLVSVTLQKALHDFITILPGLKADRGFLVEDNSDTLLHINTAADNIIVTNDYKSVACSNDQQVQLCEEEPFSTGQVYSILNFSSGQHFWEVETSENGDWAVGLAYSSIPREGETSIIGCNAQSWCLEWDSEYLSVSHNSESEVLSTDGAVESVGIFLDCENGQISFFQMADPIKPLHTFTASFTEPLHLALYVGGDGWVRIRSR